MYKPDLARAAIGRMPIGNSGGSGGNRANQTYCNCHI
jgi:hypothetical protein